MPGIALNNQFNTEKREFVLYSRKGRTDGNFSSLRLAGRLDIVHECVIASLFLSHRIRRDVVFHSFLNGPPSPPLHLKIDGKTLKDVPTDQHAWAGIFKKVFARNRHPGISLKKKSFEAFIKEKAREAPIYILEERGKDILKVDIEKNPVFILGDHIGLPQNAEIFALRFGEKISLGKLPYLAASCITLLNYLLDRSAKFVKKES